MTYAITTNLPAYRADLCELARFFWGEVPITEETESADLGVQVTLRETDGQWKVKSRLSPGEWLEEYSTPAVHTSLLEEKKHIKRALKLGLYGLLSAWQGKGLPWGALTGIRPTRLFQEQLAHGKTPDEAQETMSRVFHVEPGKAALLRQIVQVQAPYLVPEAGAYDVYVGIPFCTTRCSYCSFASTELSQGKKLVEPYVEALLKEMGETAAFMGGLSMHPRAVYVGGGTPTALTPGQLARVLGALTEWFPPKREFTVEAGRPDTIDPEKLRVIWEAGARRLSINPQTMNDKTLERIGRKHTAQDIRVAYAQARDQGFTHINADLIAALPGEVPTDFLQTLEAIQALEPDSLTVHTLAVKRSAKLHEQMHVPAAETAQVMVQAAAQAAAEMGLAPYYLYRQKYMAGNLENVGYARLGGECIYNIDIMEETTPILAFGAGGITKWLFDRQRRIERAPNVRNIEHYIQRWPEMVERKRALICTP